MWLKDVMRDVYRVHGVAVSCHVVARCSLDALHVPFFVLHYKLSIIVITSVIVVVVVLIVAVVVVVVIGFIVIISWLHGRPRKTGGIGFIGPNDGQSL